MNKRIVVATVAVAALALAVLATRLLGLWGGAGKPAPSTGSGEVAGPTGGAAVASPPPAAGPLVAQRQPEFLHDDDPVGTIRLEGQVIDSAEQPVAGAQVAIDANPVKTATTDAAGSFVFEGLIARDYRIEATSERGYAGPTRLRLTATPEPVTLRLLPGGNVVVTVTDAADGAPIAGADVELRSTLLYHAVTDDKGVATLANVGAVFAPITARAAGHASTATMMTTSGDAAAPVAIALALNRGGPVSGRVVDEHGKPVAGAVVVAVSASAPFPVTDPRRDGVVSKPDGSFAFAALAAGTWRLTATHSTFGPGTAPPIIVDGEHAKAGVELTLGAGAVVKGKVVDTAGGPIAGANVRAVVRGNVNWREQRQAFTAADGTFAIVGLSRREVEVVASHNSGSSAIAIADLASKATVDLTLTLDVVGAIDGTVVDQAGQGIGDAQVIAEPVYDGGVVARATWTVRGVQQAVTDQGGGFHFAGLPDGNYRVRAARPGASEAALDLATSVEARPGGAKLKLVVTADSKIVGKVAFKDGKVPTSFTVAIGASYPTPFATKDGSFAIASPTGVQTIVVDGKTFLAAKARDVTVVPSQVADVGTIVVEPGRSVAGRVLDEAGVPIAGAKVAAGTLLTGGGQELYIPDESIGAKDTTTDSNGRYRIEGFSPAPITIVAGKDNLGRSASVQLPGGADSATLDLVLQRTAGLEGTITSDGKPLADTIVIANPIGATRANFFSVTGADGTFALDALAPGPYIVYPIVGGGGMRPKDMYVVKVDVALGARAHVNIAATTGPVTLAVSIKSEAGAPIPMAQLFLVAADVVAAVSNSTDMRNLDQLAIFSAKPTALAMRSAMAGAGEIANVTSGVHTLCVVPLSGMPDPNGPPMPAKCQLVNVGAAAKQDFQVVIPAAMLPK